MTSPFQPARLTVYCGSRPGARPVYAEAARELGRALAKRELGLVYGGGQVGLMGRGRRRGARGGGRGPRRDPAGRWRARRSPTTG